MTWVTKLINLLSEFVTCFTMPAGLVGACGRMLSVLAAGSVLGVKFPDKYLLVVLHQVGAIFRPRVVPSARAQGDRVAGPVEKSS